MQAAAAPDFSMAAPRAVAPQPGSAASLNIMHILRAPVGGLFRHVLDIARGQAERGHRVGLIVDCTTGGARADAALAELEPLLALGLKRVAIARELGPSDVAALRAIAGHVRRAAPDVLHGHGAKGAALARLAATASGAIRVYTPHGGSLVYRPGTIGGSFYRSLEWLLKWRTDLFLFESHYVAGLFRAQIGRTPALARVVHNGVAGSEFAPVTPAADATDLVGLGELRPVKAFDVLIAALATLQSLRPPRHRDHRRRGAAGGGTQSASGALEGRRSGPLCRPSLGARGVRDGTHHGHSIAGRVPALRGAGSRRRRRADDRNPRRRHPGDLRPRRRPSHHAR